MAKRLTVSASPHVRSKDTTTGIMLDVIIALVPALVMTYVCSSYIFVSPLLFGMENRTLAYLLGGALTIALAAMVWRKIRKDARMIA